MSLIPFVMAPLHGLHVLVTRPAEQAATLRAAIQAQGGEATVFSSIEIEPIASTVPTALTDYEWILFLSVHAVRHSAQILQPAAGPRIAAIGRATGNALTSAGWTVDLIPAAPNTSEALLADPGLAISAGARVLIVRGAQGREVLDAGLTARGAQVDSLVVYRRVAAAHTPSELEQLDRRWQEEAFDIVTATSADTLNHLYEQLTPAARTRLQRTALLAASPRVAERARSLGLRGECVVAPGADESALLGALAYWYARGR